MRAASLLRPRTFATPTKGEQDWCANCRMSIHAHPRVGCSQCGGTFRACILGINKNGFSECDTHKGNK